MTSLSNRDSTRAATHFVPRHERTGLALPMNSNVTVCGLGVRLLSGPPVTMRQQKSDEDVPREEVP